jgi:hypothetical protein
MKTLTISQSMEAAPMQLRWSAGTTLSAVLSLLLIPVVGWAATAWHRPALGWFGVLLLLVIFAAAAGRAVVGCSRGILIDYRNVISLSRLQMFLWTAIVLSAFIAAALYNVFTGVGEALAIQVPNEMWILMGISTTSLVGSPLILSQKFTKKGGAEALSDTATLLQAQGFSPADNKVIGQIIGNTRPELARWSDMFTGDETSNGAHLDLAKLQMFFFTIVIATAYCAALWQMFLHAQPDGLSAFPAVDKSMLALIGISHAGYLTNKAVPRP